MTPGRRGREEAWLRLVRGESVGLAASLARLGLAGVAAGYGLVVGARNTLYDRGRIAASRVSVPVVSVGNLTLGGTGKTPAVEWVARWYRARAVRVAILSRGYGRVDAVNDEAMVLEDNLPDVPHLQDSDRTKIARIAVEELDSKLLILDDGFQHRRLARDLDIVLLDASDRLGLGPLFPRGLMRESAGSLRRAGVVILTRADQSTEAERVAIRRRAESFAGPIRWVLARHAPVGLIAEGAESEPLSRLEGRRVVAFCGIGNPEAFRRTLAELKVNLIDFRAFPDHHPYDSADIEGLTVWARSSNAGLILTTQKDYVKVRADRLGSIPLRALRVGFEILEGQEQLENALTALLPGNGP